jgi:ketosteroid isomerase-like protein
VVSDRIALVERLYGAFAVGDLDALCAAAAPDLVLEQDPALPWGGQYVGPEGIVEFFTRLVTTSETGITTEALFGAGDHVVQYGRSRGTLRATGLAYDIPEVHVWTFDGDTVTRVQFFIDSSAILEAPAP